MKPVHKSWESLDLAYTSNFGSSMFLQTLAMAFFYVCVSWVWMSIRNLASVIWYFIVLNCSPWTGIPYEDAAKKKCIWRTITRSVFVRGVQVLLSLSLFPALFWMLFLEELWALLGSFITQLICMHSESRLLKFYVLH